MKKCFLGGTCNGSMWRENLIPELQIDYFNPVVPNWTDEAYKQELEERANCDYCLYVITPKMTGVYSIAEVIDDSNKRPEKTLFVFLYEDFEGGDIENCEVISFSEHQIKSLKATGKMVRANGGKWFETQRELIDFLNNEPV